SALDQVDAVARVALVGAAQGAGDAAVEQVGADDDELARLAAAVGTAVVRAAEDVAGGGHRAAVLLAAAQAGLAGADDELAALRAELVAAGQVAGQHVVQRPAAAGAALGIAQVEDEHAAGADHFHFHLTQAGVVLHQQ